MKKKLSLLIALLLVISLTAPAASAQAAADAESENGYIVKLKDSANTVRLMSVSPLDEVSAENGLYKAESLEEIEALGSAVEYYEPNAQAYLLSLPNDKYVGKQWYLTKLGMEYVWDMGFDGEGVRVAVIDSGVNSTHQDFEGTTFDKGKNMLDGSRDLTDETGHGTFVCGVLAAAMNNGIGIAGLCGGVTLVPLKSFGKGDNTDADYIVSAIYEAVDILGCDVINLSLGMMVELRSLKEAVDHARDEGVIVISAVGNDGTSAYSYPAAYDSVVGVGSISNSGVVADFSQKNDSVFVTAPGSAIISLGYKDNRSYYTGKGTSFSAPFVAAAAILLKQYAPSADTDDFMELLKLSVHDAGPSGYDTSYGYGTLDIEAFIKAMESYGFVDVSVKYPDIADHWALESIDYCVRGKLFNGVSDTAFAPEEAMNRAMFVTVLSRMSGESLDGLPLTFTDVAQDDWFARSAAWGQATGIVSGTGNDAFSPLLSVTREQMAALLYRYANAYKLHALNASTVSLSDYPDGGDVSKWAKLPMQWAVANGLIGGRTDGSLDPQSGAKRCEVAAIVERFIRTFGSPEA